MCVSVSGKACEEHTQKRFLLDFGKIRPVDPDFFCQKPSFDPYGSFAPKNNSLDHQKICVLLDLMYSPFLFSFIVLKIECLEIF